MKTTKGPSSNDVKKFAKQTLGGSIARQAVRESLVLLKNDGNVLPLTSRTYAMRMMRIPRMAVTEST